MHGLGDNIHQRAVVRDLLKSHNVFLETPWPIVYHDLDVNFVRPRTTLRTQKKNEQREGAKFSDQPKDMTEIRPWYHADHINKLGTIMDAMNHVCGTSGKDFSLPIPKEWKDKAKTIIGATKKPIMFYRPLVDRTEWDGCLARNPSVAAYHQLVMAIREDYYLVSIADLVDGVEWQVSRDVEPDATFHKGELDFETLAGLASMSLVFCSPGFSVILGQSVKTHVVTVFGAYDVPQCFDHGRSKDLFIPPIEKCQIFQKPTDFDKTIDLDRWIPKLRRFSDDYKKQAVR